MTTTTTKKPTKKQENVTYHYGGGKKIKRTRLRYIPDVEIIKEGFKNKEI